MGAEPHAVIDAERSGGGLFEEVECVWHGGRVAGVGAWGKGVVSGCGAYGGSQHYCVLFQESWELVLGLNCHLMNDWQPYKEGDLRYA